MVAPTDKEISDILELMGLVPATANVLDETKDVEGMGPTDTEISNILKVMGLAPPTTSVLDVEKLLDEIEEASNQDGETAEPVGERLLLGYLNSGPNNIPVCDTGSTTPEHQELIRQHAECLRRQKEMAALDMIEAEANAAHQQRIKKICARMGMVTKYIKSECIQQSVHPRVLMLRMGYM